MAIKIKQNGAWKDVETKSSDCKYHIIHLSVKTDRYNHKPTAKEIVNSNTMNVLPALSGRTTPNTSYLIRTTVTIDCGFEPRLVLPFYSGSSKEGNNLSTDYMLNPVILASPQEGENSVGFDRRIRCYIEKVCWKYDAEGNRVKDDDGNDVRLSAGTNHYFLQLFTHPDEDMTAYFKIISFK